MALALDHLLWAAPDLDAGASMLADLCGVESVVGGSHPGFGTRNRLMAIAPDVFFEIIAPDPAQTIEPGTRAAAISTMLLPGLLTFAVQTDSIDAACELAAKAGLEVGERRAMSRTRPDGVRLAWTVVAFTHAGYGPLIPFAIDWQGSPHPATSTPGGCVLKSFTALHPKPKPLEAIYRALGLQIPVQGAIRAGFVAILDTPNGEVCLTST